MMTESFFSRLLADFGFNAIWDTLKTGGSMIGRAIGHGVSKETAQKIGEMTVNGITKSFDAWRAELIELIDVRLRAEDAFAASTLMRRHGDRVRGFAYRGAHRIEFPPISEQVFVHELSKLLQKLGETRFMNLMKQWGRLSDEDFDSRLEFVIHDPALQFLHRVWYEIRRAFVAAWAGIARLPRPQRWLVYTILAVTLIAGIVLTTMPALFMLAGILAGSPGTVAVAGIIALLAVRILWVPQWIRAILALIWVTALPLALFLLLPTPVFMSIPLVVLAILILTDAETSKQEEGKRPWLRSLAAFTLIAIATINLLYFVLSYSASLMPKSAAVIKGSPSSLDTWLATQSLLGIGVLYIVFAAIALAVVLFIPRVWRMTTTRTTTGGTTTTTTTTTSASSTGSLGRSFATLLVLAALAGVAYWAYWYTPWQEMRAWAATQTSTTDCRDRKEFAITLKGDAAPSTIWIGPFYKAEVPPRYRLNILIAPPTAKVEAGGQKFPIGADLGRELPGYAGKLNYYGPKGSTITFEICKVI